MSIRNLKFQDIPLRSIEAHPKYVGRGFRNEFDHERLLHSIEEYGLLRPLVVHKFGDRFEVVDGHRRLRCLHSLEFDTVPCMVHEHLVLGDYAHVRYDLNDTKSWTKAEMRTFLKREKEAGNPAYEKMRNAVLLASVG